MSNHAPIETSPYAEPASNRTPTITMARLIEWFEAEIQDLKSLAIAAPTTADAYHFSVRASQVIIMQEHMQSETFRALDEAAE